MIDPNRFTYTSLPTRVLFDHRATDAVAAEVTRLGLHRILIVHAPGERALAMAKPVAKMVASNVLVSVSVFNGAREHVPVEVLDACLAEFEASKSDGIVALGGGSAIGLGKLAAARAKVALIAVPTTYSGAELTPFNAVTENGVKRQLRDLAMLPSAVIYDPGETLSLPMSVTGPSMMNAVAHAIEALYAPETNPIVALKAAEAIRLAAGALPRVAQRLADRDARAELMLSAMLAGEVLAVTSMGLHHKMCHLLGGGYGLPHAGTNAVILPYAVAYNARGAPEAMRRVGAALGVATDDVAGALYDLAQASGAPASLAALGLAAKDLDAIARAAAAQNYPNPVALDAARLRDMLTAAWHGHRPGRT